MRPCVLAFAVLAFALNATRAAASLESQIDQILTDKELSKGEFGVVVAKIGDNPTATTVLYRRNPNTPRTPASNLKILTTSAFLDKVGADFKFKTLLVRHGQDLILIGDGDPTLGDAEFLKKTGWGTTTVFKNWAQALAKQNITSVRDVLVDDSVFEEVMYHPHWPENQYAQTYSAEVAGINFNANCINMTVRPGGGAVVYTLDPPTKYVTVTNTCRVAKENHVILTRNPTDNDLILKGSASASNTYSITIRDPALYAGRVMYDTFAAEGVDMTGTVKRDRGVRAAMAANAGAYQVIAMHETPISAALGRANKDSMNLYAECMCKRLGFEVTHQSGSWENGPAAVGAFLTRVGIRQDEFKLDDGCGLSHQDKISPAGIARVLIYDYFSPNHETFMKSLAVGGQDGTLEKRFEGDLKGRVFAKSGYVNNVSALSGFLKAKNGSTYVFSILMNALPAGTNNTAKAIQEKIIKAVDSQ